MNPSLDPFPGLPDSPAWESLLAAEHQRSGSDPAGLYGTLLGLRCMGCTIAPDADGDMRLFGPPGTNRETLTLWIGGHGDAVRAAVASLEAAPA